MNLKRPFSLLSLFLSTLLVFQSFGNASEFGNFKNSKQQTSDVYPQGPNKDLTPGDLCTSPDAHRYPEHIAYCNRNVEPELKAEIVRKYQALGFSFNGVKREDYKIDHYFPLCMGGSNRPENLWPQHRKIFEITDPLEPALCEKLSQGRITQRQAVDLIITAKNSLEKVGEILKQVQAM